MPAMKVSAIAYYLFGSYFKLNILICFFLSVGCRSDSECPPTQACINRECINTCQQTYCGTNAECRADYNHRARCYCLPGYRGNPLVACDRPECTLNPDCPFNLACVNEKCRDPCNCGEGAQCRVDNHVATCKCPPGYAGDGHTKCTPSKSWIRCSIAKLILKTKLIIFFHFLFFQL